MGDLVPERKPILYWQNPLYFIGVSIELVIIMLLIICAKYGRKPSRTVCAVERTREEGPYFSSFIAKSWLNDLEDIDQGQRSLFIEVYLFWWSLYLHQFVHATRKPYRLTFIFRHLIGQFHSICMWFVSIYCSKSRYKSYYQNLLHAPLGNEKNKLIRKWDSF